MVSLLLGLLSSSSNAVTLSEELFVTQVVANCLENEEDMISSVFTHGFRPDFSPGRNFLQSI
ncbi:hypothetical protein A2U01_0070399 [Trifolium medium]|uniref:Uncharacterized protein n=1 Tax=Trifolium medium TaxID=97028 RepID=A0A392SMQ0_9FABA|nr:hypothetical protein [Trifolium medium]